MTDWDLKHVHANNYMKNANRFQTIRSCFSGGVVAGNMHQHLRSISDIVLEILFRSHRAPDNFTVVCITDNSNGRKNKFGAEYFQSPVTQDQVPDSFHLRL